ncbi:uncharacterized protein LOC132264496 [Phlebotomus argentipes]|uniref:uncharacterized protein LOC132257528 n=1 Tax=Phlebotomus argentipes TaxID=94469 RepID=UPI0028936D9F|nr:uncharacterized protein LOC132257528 [Phlebotomus argentipes]XP_059620707.1 uncharacterized protein LOC132264496 [Phlebotomus argentipes]
MKSFSSAEASASKSSGSHKKSSVASRSKSKKSSQNPGHSSASLEPTPSTSEKSRYKNYAGISTKSVKCYWEQHEKQETDVSNEACSRVAEDVTYKLWELANTLKTYARHSDGRVTVDLVNEALKDANVCPILGAGSSEWDTIEYDGVFHFNKDRIVDLREEYLRDVQVTTSRVDVSASWLAEETMSEHLLDFMDHLCDAVFLGDELTFNRAMQTVAMNPFMGCIVNLLLNKCTELLSFEYKTDTLRRAMELLITLTRNPFARNAEINSDMYYLCQILVCLLLGPANQGTGGGGGGFAAEVAPTSDFQANPDLSMYNGIDITDIKNECETFFIMMENNGLEMKADGGGGVSGVDQQSNIVRIKSELMDTFDQYNGSAETMDYCEASQNQMCFKQEENSSAAAQQPEPAAVAAAAAEEDVKTMDNHSESVFWREDECGVISTQMCDFECVELVCECLGRLGSFWGLAERRCCNLIRSRLKEFFARDSLQLHWEFEWLVRVFRAMWALGENPFREFSVYLERIDPSATPEWVLQEFNVAAVYICGHGDSYLYDLLYSLCGDSLLPFMIYNTKKLHKIAIKSATESHIKYKIVSKVALKTCSRRQSLRWGVEEEECFERRELKRGPPRIGFRFAGCRPVLLPRKASQTVSIPARPVQNAEMLDKFNRRVVIARRKLFTSLTNRRSVRNVDDVRCVNL